MTADPAVVARIRKILAKTEESNCTPAEAETAINVASAMMAKHGISTSELSAPTDAHWANSQIEILLWYKRQYPGSNLGRLPAGLREYAIKPARCRRIAILSLEYNEIVAALQMLPNCADDSWGFMLDRGTRFYISPGDSIPVGGRGNLVLPGRQWSIDVPGAQIVPPRLIQAITATFPNRVRFLGSLP